MRRILVPLALVLLALTPAAASAQDARIGLSRDAVHWSPALDAPLFDPGFVWVPGDEQVRSFYVRNESVDPAVLTVEILGRESDSLIETGDLTVSARGADGPWLDVSVPGTHTLVKRVGAEAGAPQRVEVRVSFDVASTNQSQLRQLDLDLRVTLRQDGVGAADSGLLPGTGGPALAWALAGLLLLALGIVTARSRQKEIHHV